MKIEVEITDIRREEVIEAMAARLIDERHEYDEESGEPKPTSSYDRKEIGKHLKRYLDDRLTKLADEYVREHFDEVIKARIAATIDAVLAEGWVATDEYGNARGPRADLKARINAHLTTKVGDRYSSNSSTMVDQLAKAAIETTLKTDFGKGLGAARACRDFEMLVGAPTLCSDVHDLEPADLIRFFGATAPDVIMMSPPCKGFSGLLSAKRAAEPHYQKMNTLMERALFLAVETWDPPPALIFVENVPRIASRGKVTIARCLAMGAACGYAIAQGTHDCGELGGLAQHRRRYFQLWRHRKQVPQFVYEPPKLRVRACGEVLGPMPMPGDVELAGPMHSVPKLSWRNWVRLSLIPAGGDWRDLPGTLDEGEKRREKFRRAPVTPWDATAETVTGPGGSAAAAVADPRFGNVDRVTDWADPVGTITRSPAPSSGAGAVADPRYTNIMQVVGWDDAARTVIGASRVGSGAMSVADPRWGGGRLGVAGWADPLGTVAGESLPNNGRFSVADPRIDPVTGNKPAWQRVAGVTPWDEAAPTIIGGAKIHAGAFQVADPRVTSSPRAGAYRVLRWEDAAATITGSLSIDNGAAAIADPRLNPDRPPPFTPMIIAADGTWHRPLTTLELAALQGFPTVIDGKPLVLAGTSHTRWREAIGNAVPPPAALAIAEQLLRALLIATLGAFALDNSPVWVAPHQKALVA